jgi:hypothetical protein
MVARVSLDLSRPIRPRVRSSRNVICVETDRLDRAAVISTASPATVIRDLRGSPRCGDRADVAGTAG